MVLYRILPTTSSRLRGMRVIRAGFGAINIMKILTNRDKARLRTLGVNKLESTKFLAETEITYGMLETQETRS